MESIVGNRSKYILYVQILHLTRITSYFLKNKTIACIPCNRRNIKLVISPKHFSFEQNLNILSSYYFKTLN